MTPFLYSTGSQFDSRRGRKRVPGRELISPVLPVVLRLRYSSYDRKHKHKA